MRKPEILAPAGSPETLSAALRAGADAVYAGGRSYSARSSAVNFDDDQLIDAVRLCHKYGAKLYLAVNTLISDTEAEDFCNYIKLTSSMGVDGYIVQDWGAADIIRQAVPDAVIHASTQMSVHTAAGSELLRDMGYVRVVPARELDKSALERICRLDVETEVFVHGALCMSVSGQCYMSAMMGARSANRGCCGQACRLPFSAAGDKNKAALSLKDLSLLPRIEQLVDTGVDSLKIEGRMKRPEYVAAAVHELDNALEGKRPDMQLLRGIFSRSGFTDGYFTGERRDMFGVREKEDVTAARTLIPKIHELYRFERAVWDVDFSVTAVSGEPLRISASCGDISVSAVGDIPDKAQNRPTDAAAFEKQLSKLGDTVFRFRSLNADISGDIFVPAGRLNEMRRELADKLTDAVIQRNTPVYSITDYRPHTDETRPTGGGGLRTFCRTREQALAAAELSEFVMLPEKLITPELLDLIPADKLMVSPPRFITDEDKLAERLEQLSSMGISHILCHTPDSIALGKKAGMKLHGSFSLNVFNSYSAERLKSLGLEDCIASFELTVRQLRELRTSLPLGAVTYGRLPLMLTRNCPIQNEVGCSKCTGQLVDRTGRRYPVACSKEYVEILNPDVLYMPEELDFMNFRAVWLSTEDKEQTMAALRGERPEGRPTRGLYSRGLQEVL